MNTPRRSFLKTLLGAAIATPALARIVENSKARGGFIPNTDSPIMVNSGKETLDVIVCDNGKAVPLRFRWKDAVNAAELFRDESGHVVGVALNHVPKGGLVEVVPLPRLNFVSR